MCREMVNEGKIIFMLTHFEEEDNAQVDHVHRELVKLGVVMDNSITVSAALGKVSVLLGKFQDRECVISLLKTNLKGETDLSQQEHSLKAHNPNIIMHLIENVQNLKNTEIEVFTDNIQFELEMKLLESEQPLVIESVLGLTSLATKNNHGQSALHILILSKDEAFLEILGKLKVDFNILDKDGNSCLFLCLRRKQYTKCSIIIKYNGRFVANPKHLAQMIIKAVKNNDIEFFKYWVLYRSNGKGVS
jgi:hypothetical protein